MVDKGGTGASSTGKSLLEEKEKWEAACKSTERDAVFDPARHDSVNTPIGGDIEFVLCALPRRTAAPRSEAALPIDAVLSSAAQPPTLFEIGPEAAWCSQEAKVAGETGSRAAGEEQAVKGCALEDPSFPQGSPGETSEN
jgi:hypothetical protein